MEPELQAYYDNDPGFAQFVQRHGTVAAMPDIRKAYRRWEYDLILDRLDEERREERRVAEMEKQLADREAMGEAKGKAEGKAENQMEIAIKAFAGLKRGKSVLDIIDALKEFDIPDGTIESAKKQAEAEMGTGTRE